jgi:hypothetical protein
LSLSRKGLLLFEKKPIAGLLLLAKEKGEVLSNQVKC